MELEELKRLMAINEKAVLSRRIDPIGTEYEVVVDALSGIGKVRIGERDLELPGLARHRDIIIKTLAEFKDKEKKNVMPLQYAKSDDIVVMALRPQHFGLQGYAKDVAIPSGKFTAVDNIIPATAGVFTVPDKQIFIITDFVDVVAESPVTAIKVENVDGIPQYAFEVRKELKITDLHLIEMDYPIIADASIDIDALVWSKTAGATVSHELTPFGVWIGYGKAVPALRTET